MTARKNYNKNNKINKERARERKQSMAFVCLFSVKDAVKARENTGHPTNAVWLWRVDEKVVFHLLLHPLSQRVLKLNLIRLGDEGRPV